MPIPPRDRTRRHFLLATAALATVPLGASAEASGVASSALSEIESAIGGRIGVLIMDTGDGREIAHRADERFAMCSTFKWVLAAAVLARVDRGHRSLEDRIAYGREDLLDYAPVARRHLARGYMTLGELAQAAVTVSDNTAANLLLAELGGPATLTAFVRALGDAVTRFDRDEPTLNDNAAGDPRDTTAPRAMVGLMRRLLVGNDLSIDSRDLLLHWLRTCETGGDRLRAGLPRYWDVGDKTGTGGRGAVNDVAIAFPPGRPPILITAYLSDSAADRSRLSAALAAVGVLAARRFG